MDSNNKAQKLRGGPGMIGTIHPIIPAKVSRIPRKIRKILIIYLPNPL